MALGDDSSKETEVLKKEKTTDEGEGTSTVGTPDPEESKKELEEETSGSETNENPDAPKDSIPSFFMDFLFIIFLPINPFYACLKSANPVFNKIFQLIEERAAYVLNLMLTGSTWSSAWDLFKQVINGLKSNFINFFFGKLNPVWETASFYYYQFHTGIVESLDQIDRIYFNIVPAVPNVTPYFDTTERNLSIRNRCLYMVLNLVHRLVMHTKNFLVDTARYYLSPKTSLEYLLNQEAEPGFLPIL